MKKIFFLAFLAISIGAGSAQSLKKHEAPQALNPILPGYFADPTIKKIGDTYYIYATTDGNGWGAGPSQVWTSTDFKNWTIQPMNWPNTHWYWAPDMTKGYDERYYLYYSQPVEIFGAVSDTPTGPWQSLADTNKSIIPNYMIPGVITLDGQTFTDHDGRIYMYWGTWGIYPDHGCAVGLMRQDMKSFEKIELIPNTVAKDFFEAPYMFERNGIYYMMYSSGHCEDHTYRVQYIKSKVGPMGPFEYPADNPILVTNEDGTIHGPGHHSVLEEDGRYYIVYHRHNNPHSGGGFHRQVAVDELFFTPEGDIQKVVPTHEGIADLIKPKSYPEDRAFGMPVAVSSFYNEDFRASFLVDDNNGTLWRAKDNHQPAWLMIDLEKITDVQTVAIQFEYPTYAYQYRIETSTDAKNWTPYDDQSNNNRWASPVLSHGKVKARYVRLHILNTQLAGLPRGVWNIKVYDQHLKQKTVWSAPQNMSPDETVFGSLIHIDALGYREGERITTIQNKGLLDGALHSEKPVYVKNYQGKKAFFLNGSASLRSTFSVPPSLAGNSPYTVSMWINNPIIDRFENVVAWSKGNQDISKAIFGYGKDEQRGAVTHGAWPDLGFKTVPLADQWHHIIISFDGYMERIYVDGQLQREENRMLFVHPADYFVVGASDLLDQHFSGYLADLKVANVDLSATLINEGDTFYNPKNVSFVIQTDDLAIGKVHKVRNHGSSSPHDIVVDQGEVLLQGDRTAIKMGAWKDPVLNNIIAQTSYTVAFDWFDGQIWNHGLALYDQGKSVFYNNGKQGEIKQMNKLLRIKNGQLGLKYAFHFFSAYPGKFSLDQINENYQIWKVKSGGDLNGYTPIIAVKPYWINDGNVFIQIREDRSDLLYLFSSDQHDSGWIQKPYHLFDRAHMGKTISVFAKDEFGNVSKALVVDIPKSKPLLMTQSVTQTFKLGQKEIPYWDGYQVGAYPDSTKVSMTGSNGQWNLSSKHTKWGDAALLPPFVFKELEGDFTIEVYVKDVVGLAAKTRTSSEAGIMVQAMENPNTYINNTILTGWNLGNLARSIGSRMHQEGNNGTGLQFFPYIQVQRVDDYFFLRSSQDGISWIDLPDTPFLRKDWKGQKLRVGLYQIATNNQEGYGLFEQVKIWQ
jgi:hypothetical protein